MSRPALGKAPSTRRVGGRGAFASENAAADVGIVWSATVYLAQHDFQAPELLVDWRPLRERVRRARRRGDPSEWTQNAEGVEFVQPAIDLVQLGRQRTN